MVLDKGLRNRLALLVLVAAISAVLYFVLAPHIASDQVLRLHFGSGASRITRVELTLRTPNGLERNAEFTYANGAPPAAYWRFSRENGPVSIDVTYTTADSFRRTSEQVTLDGHEHTIECPLQ